MDKDFDLILAQTALNSNEIQAEREAISQFIFCYGFISPSLMHNNNKTHRLLSCLVRAVYHALFCENDNKSLNFEPLKTCIANCVDTDIYTATRDWFLLFVAFKGDIEVAKVLIEHGANPNARHLEGQTPLIIAATQGKTQFTRWIAQECGAEVNARVIKSVLKRDLCGWTALMHTIAMCQTETMIMLISELGVDPNQHNYADNDSSPAIFNAVATGNSSIILALIELGAQSNVCRRDGLPLVLFACAQEHFEIAFIVHTFGSRTSVVDIAKFGSGVGLGETQCPYTDFYAGEHALRSLFNQHLPHMRAALLMKRAGRFVVSLYELCALQVCRRMILLSQLKVQKDSLPLSVAEEIENSVSDMCFTTSLRTHDQKYFKN